MVFPGKLRTHTHTHHTLTHIYIYIYIYIIYVYIIYTYAVYYIYYILHIYTSSGKGCPLAFQRVLNDSCEPERWYIQRIDEENTIYLVLRVLYHQSSAIKIM